jgi:uncharacterized protein YeeX (DUF496 family)
MQRYGERYIEIKRDLEDADWRVRDEEGRVV